MSYTDQKPTILDRVNQHKRCLFCRYERRHAFNTKTKNVNPFTNRTWIAKWLWGNTIFTSERLKRRAWWCTKLILWMLNSSPILTLLLCLCYIFCAQKSRQAKWKVHISKLSSVGFGRREEGTQYAANYSFLSVHKLVHILWRHFCLVFNCH